MAETNGAIYGIVSEEGSIKVGTDVVLMDHATLSIIAKTITDQYGGYMFNNLDPDKTDYMLFTVDNDGVEPKNALIKDYVQPVTTANGDLAGNFMGTLDSLAPTLSGIPIYRNGGTAGSTIGCVVARPHGGSHCVGSNADWGGFQGWSDQTATPPTDACPIPTNPLIRAIKHTAGWTGWVNRPLRFEFFEKRLAYDLAETPKISANAPFTMFFTHKTDPAGPMTYSMTHNMLPMRDAAYNQTKYNSSVFYPDEPSFFVPDCFYNVCIEADHTLRLKWLIDNGGAPAAASKKNILVATLDANKWYAITVRVGDFAASTKVDVCDIVAGTVVTYDVAAIVSINKHQNYGSRWGYGEPRRHGFRISGPHNQAVNNTFNTWDSNNGWTWKAFTTGNGYSGPWAQWNRKITDAEVTALMRSIYDTGTLRTVPRGISEIMKHAPQLYVPFDEYPNNIPRVTKQGQRVGLIPVGSSCFVSDSVNAFSIRRRRIVASGEGKRIRPISCFGPNAFTCVAFFYQPVADGVGPLVNLYHHGNGCNQDYYGDSDYHNLRLSVESLGRPRAYWRNTSDGYNDNYFGTSSNLQNVGHHMVAFVFDIYYGVKITAYVDGALQGTVSVPQQQLDSHTNGISPSYFGGSELLLGAGAQVNNSPNWSSGAFATSGLSHLRSTLLLSDFVAYNGCLDQAAIAEMYNAYLIAVGPDSHE